MTEPVASSTASTPKAAKVLRLATAVLLASVLVIPVLMMLSAFFYVSMGTAVGSGQFISGSYIDYGTLRGRIPFSSISASVDSDAIRDDNADDKDNISDYYYLIMHYRHDEAGRGASQSLARLLAYDAKNDFRPMVRVPAASGECPTLLLHPRELNVVEAPDLSACDARSLVEGVMIARQGEENEKDSTSPHDEKEKMKERRRGIKIVHVAPLAAISADSSGLIASNLAELGKLRETPDESLDESLRQPFGDQEIQRQSLESHEAEARVAPRRAQSRRQRFGDEAIQRESQRTPASRRVQVLTLVREDLDERPRETALRFFDFLLPGVSNEASREWLAETYAMARLEMSS